MSKGELACVYSILMLADDEIAVTSDKINTILKAANINVEPYLPGLFASALEGKDVKDLLMSFGSVGAGAAAAPAPAVSAPSQESSQPEKKETKPPVEESDSEDGMGFALFDD